MKKGMFFCGLAVALLLTSCEYFGDFSFIVDNTTNDSVYISYIGQMWSIENAFPTFNRPEDYKEARLSDDVTTEVVVPHDSLMEWYDVGMVCPCFPTEADIPENYDVVPLWKRIVCIVVGTDTLDEAAFAEDKWIRKGSTYTLRLL